MLLAFYFILQNKKIKNFKSEHPELNMDVDFPGFKKKKKNVGGSTELITCSLFPATKQTLKNDAIIPSRFLVLLSRSQAICLRESSNAQLYFTAMYSVCVCVCVCNNLPIPNIIFHSFLLFCFNHNLSIIHGYFLELKMKKSGEKKNPPWKWKQFQMFGPVVYL